MRPQDLLDRLAAGYEYDPMYGALCNERDQLKAENAKLRELVDELYPLADYGAMDASELDRAHDLMRDVGIEVPS
jgi:hypothetical protein